MRAHGPLPIDSIVNPALSEQVCSLSSDLPLIKAQENSMLRKITFITMFLTLIGSSLFFFKQKTAYDIAGCAYTFTSGANNTYLNYCLTANGNILQLTIPQTHQ